MKTYPFTGSMDGKFYFCPTFTIITNAQQPMYRSEFQQTTMEPCSGKGQHSGRAYSKDYDVETTTAKAGAKRIHSTMKMVYTVPSIDWCSQSFTPYCQLFYRPSPRLPRAQDGHEVDHAVTELQVIAL
jgi:hypothetical protein